MTRYDIEQPRGDSFDLQLNFSGISDSVASPLNISGDTIYFTIKDSNSSKTGDADAIYSQDVVSHTSAISGISEVSYPAATGALFNVGQYDYDIVWGKADGTVKTLVLGKFNLIQDITVRD